MTTHPETSGKPNRLIHSKSPYLLQHAYNPVDWYPWGKEALDRARTDDKPVFLSIGYSTCHWCHVMERESFEDPEVARVMNEALVSVKVDREERPDLDHLYMTVAQLMTGSGGWPLNVFITPEGKPFYAATYIPPRTRAGHLGLLELVPEISRLWKEQRSAILEHAEKVTEELDRPVRDITPGPVGPEALSLATEQLSMEFDHVHAGFGSAPKFPAPHNLRLLLRSWKRSQEDEILDMVLSTLRAIRAGGIYDQLGFGIHRYATDSAWLVPHFEKTLYDQAGLVLACVEAFQVSGDPEFRRIAGDTLTYVLTELAHPPGGFYCGEDADTEGEEGKFYVWTLKEIRALLSPADAALAEDAYRLTLEGNFPPQSNSGRCILHRGLCDADLAGKHGLSAPEVRARMEGIRLTLLEARNRRSRPHKDRKVLTDWTGFMIAALARAGAVLDHPPYVETARRSADFILTRLRDDRERLLHRYADGEPAFHAFADDYAFMVWGLIELYQACFDVTFLREALRLNREMLDLFYHPASGGFFQTAHDAERLISRQKIDHDGALPGANSVAAMNLLTLAELTADHRLSELAQQTLQTFAVTLKQLPTSHAHMLLAVDFMIGPAWEIAIAGEADSPDTRRFLKAIHSRFLPNHVLLLRPARDAREIVSLAPFTADMTPLDHRTAAYVCHNHTSKPPTTDPDAMLRLIQSD